jgi:site-specific DNA-cytosine methylase
MKIIYLAAFKAYHPNWNMDYQDINGKRNIPGDMLEVDLTPYDVIIATPPCNYYSRANYRREISIYSQKTKHLLPGILNKLIKLDKPFIVENVINRVRMKDIINSFNGWYYEIGRHSYFTNIPFNASHIKQEYDFKYGGVQLNSKNNRQGGKQVHEIIEYWLNIVKEKI